MNSLAPPVKGPQAKLAGKGVILEAPPLSQERRGVKKFVTHMSRVTGTLRKFFAKGKLRQDCKLIEILGVDNELSCASC